MDSREKNERDDDDDDDDEDNDDEDDDDEIRLFQGPSTKSMRSQLYY